VRSVVENLIIQTGKLAVQATSAVTYSTAAPKYWLLYASPRPEKARIFLPVNHDYEERLYAAGKIPGGFIRREGRPSQEATLASR